jgi:L-rhamnose isomerase
VTDDQLENNYLEASAQRVANWLVGHRNPTGMQRAILASLGQAIDDVLQGDAPGDQLVASPTGAPAGVSEQGLIGR